MSPHPQPLEDRFWSKTQPDSESGCVLWTGASQGHGKHRFGVFGLNQFDRIRLNLFQRMALAHRVAYSLVNGPIPFDYEVIHLCGNTLCVNPDHLQAGTLMERVDAHRESHKRNVPYGERTPTAKLTNKQVSEIRVLLLTEKPKDIAVRYDISLNEIYCIKHGKAWKRDARNRTSE